jgi:hypothetical protein
MTVRVKIINEENESSPHNILVGVMDSYSEDFIERYVVLPQNEVVINIFGTRNIVIAEETKKVVIRDKNPVPANQSEAVFTS